MKVIDHKVYTAVVKNRLTISVTQMTSDRVSIRVNVNQDRARVRGILKLNVYKGSKIIGTIDDVAKAEYLFVYRAKDAGCGRYKAELVTTAGKKVSRATSPKANVFRQKVCMKPGAYEAYTTGYMIRSISYRGKDLVVKGYTYNTFGMPVQDYISAGARCGDRILFDEFQMMTVPAGIRHYDFIIKNARVVDLRNRNVVLT